MYDHKVLPDMTGVCPDSKISLVRYDPVKEMDVLRRVVLRDALVSILAEQRRKILTGGKLCFKTFLQALVETREASLEVIDAITRWRLTLIRPEAFNVGGENYAVTMTTDVGFLATGLSPLKEALGMEFGTGNPFALPCACAPKTPAAAGRRGIVKGGKGRPPVTRGAGSGKTGIAEISAIKGIRDMKVATAVRGAEERGSRRQDAHPRSTTAGKGGPKAESPTQSNKGTKKNGVGIVAIGELLESVKSSAISSTCTSKDSIIDDDTQNSNKSNKSNNDDDDGERGGDYSYHSNGSTSAELIVLETEDGGDKNTVGGLDCCREGKESQAQTQQEQQEQLEQQEEQQEREYPHVEKGDVDTALPTAEEREGDGEAASMSEMLSTLGKLDEEQRARLARAQLFLEEEVSRREGAEFGLLLDDLTQPRWCP